MMDIEPKKDDYDQHQNKIHHEYRDESSTSQGSPRSPPPPRPSPYAEHGPLIDRSQTAELNSKKALNAALMWPRIRHYARGPFAEFMGTFILIMFGDGVVAQVVLSKDKAGDYQSISWGWVRQYLVDNIVVYN